MMNEALSPPFGHRGVSIRDRQWAAPAGCLPTGRPVRDRTGTPGESGFTLVELLVAFGVIALLAAIATVGYRQARLRAAEAAVISALATINQAQFTYMQTCGRHRYAPSLVALGMPVPGSPSGYLSPDLTASDPLFKSGYIVQMSGTESGEGEQTCTGLTPLERYRLTADPQVPGGTGSRFFGTNVDRVIYGDTVSFAEDMPEAGPPGHGAEIR